jgi:8-oxo-dGTP pyrophosphatase MutT (NUDIX family)
MPKTVICRDIDGGQCEVQADKLQWRPSAYGIVVRDGKLLTAKHFGRHNLPGGGLDIGETPEEAVVREVKEETGIDVINPRFITATSQFFVWPTAATGTHFYETILMYFYCDFAGGELSVDGFDEHEKQYAELAEWCPLAALDDIQLTGTHDWRDAVRQALTLPS